MAKFKEGESGNINGRPAGAVNRVTKPIKEKLSDFLTKKLNELPSIWVKLSARDQATLLKDLLPFFMAKQSDVKVEFEIDKMSDAELDQIINRLIKKPDEKIN